MNHTFVNGPYGDGYHCRYCGISKIDDHAFWDTCELWRKHVGSHPCGGNMRHRFTRRGEPVEFCARCGAWNFRVYWRKYVKENPAHSDQS